MSFIRNLLGHIRTVSTHRHHVFILCCKCGIPLQGIFHDLSKYSPSEFIPGIKYWTGKASPQVEERKEYGYSAAWLHHKGRNKHHFEYWTDYVDSLGIQPIEMPNKWFAEMVCDRIAACKVYLGDQYTTKSPLNYYLYAKGHYFIHEKTARRLEEILRYLADNGEDATMKYLKESIVSNS